MDFVGVAPMRPQVAGKFIHVGSQRFLVKGVAYGTFAPRADGSQFPDAARIADDFGTMRCMRVNTVRTYTPPPPELLDTAVAEGLRLMVGVPWSQHVAFLDDRTLCREIRREVEREVRRLASHDAILLFALGNEIPPPVVRWHGARRVEQFLRELYDAAKSAAPDRLFTYVNYPPTEYLELPFLDVCAFNVYLHREQDLRRYIARLQNIAGTRPLLLTEAGADRIREGELGQAELTAMQLRAAYAEGAAGAVAFAWTDEWWRGGSEVHDWAFGLVDRERRPKPALHAVARVFGEAPFSEAERRKWPKVSVLICAYNAQSTINECLQSLGALTYPNFEVVVVNDGSTDATGEIARRYPVKVIDTPNGGLSAARNVAAAHAAGEIIAYTDADVRVDPDWLTYLVQPFLTSDVSGAGGLNVVPPDDHWMAQCVARSPGAPTHVLLDDRIAEHVPGCNMAFRRDALLAIDGFDPIYRAAGDDVDLCWRLQARGMRIGFAPSALVWHRHRSSVRAYWRQQVGYGESEPWLMAHHPDKFLDGQARWRGRIYSPLPLVRSISRLRVNTGVWGTAAFPSVYCNTSAPLSYMPHMLWWQAAALGLLAASLVAAMFSGTRVLAAVLAAAGGVGLAATVASSAVCALRTDIRSLAAIGQLGRASALVYRAVIMWLHFVQPLARVRGRIRGKLSPPQMRGDLEPDAAEAPRAAVIGVAAFSRLFGMGGLRRRFWSETWIDRPAVLSRITERLRASGIGRMIEIDDGWQDARDLSVAVSRWLWLDLHALVEEHARGRCLLRVRARLRASWMATVVAILVVSFAAIWQWLDLPAAAVLLLFLAALAGRGLVRTARTISLVLGTVEHVALSAGMLAMDAPVPLPATAAPAAAVLPFISAPRRAKAIEPVAAAAAPARRDNGSGTRRVKLPVARPPVYVRSGGPPARVSGAIEPR